MSKNITRKIMIGSLFAVLTFVPIYSVASAADLVACEGVEDCNYDTFIKTINNLIQKIIVLAAAGSAILLAYAGFLYITAQGDTGKISQAHKIFKNVAIGFIIILLAWLIVSKILEVFGAKGGFEKVLSK